MSDISVFRTEFPLGTFSLNAAATLAMDTQNESIFSSFTPYEDCTITTVGFICASKTGTVPNDAYTVSIQGLTTAGMPDGTILGGASPASATFPNATYPEAGFGTNTAHAIALSNSIALTGGTTYTLVVRLTGATDLSNFLTLRFGYTAGGLAFTIPYCGTSDATPTYAKATGGNLPIGWFVRSASKTYGWPIIALSTRNCGTTAEVGFSFTMPSGFGASNTIGLRGMIFQTGTGSGLDAAATYTANVYSSVTGVNPVIEQTTGAADSDFCGSTSTSRVAEVVWPAIEPLVPGTKYGVGIDTSGATGWSMMTYTIPAAGDRTAFTDGALTVMTRTLASAYPPDASDGAFTEVTTEIVNGCLLFTDFTAAAAGGGGMKIVGSGGLAG